MIGFLGGLGVALVSRLLTGLVVSALVAAGVWYFFFRTPAVEPIALKRELDWKQEHLRRRVVADAVTAVVREAPTPGIKNSILLAPFRGDNAVLSIRDSIYNGLIARGYNGGEVRRLAKAVAVSADAPVETRNEPGFFQKLKNLVGLGGDETEVDIKQDDLADSLCYVEGAVGHDLKSDALSLSLQLAAAPIYRKDGKWQRKEETVPLESLTAELTPGTTDYWRVWMHATGGWARLLTWLAVVGLLPWLAAALIKKVVEWENNAASATVLIGFTLIGAAATWALQGMGPEGVFGWVVLIVGILTATLYNWAVCEWMASRFEG